MHPVVISLLGDARMFPGMVLLLATLRSRFQACRECRIYLFHQGLDESQLERLREICAAPDCRLIVREIDVSFFRQFPSFNGDHLTYGRLLLPELLAGESRVVYLDCDLLVNLDVATLFDQDLGGRPIGAVPYGKVGLVDDWGIFQKKGFSPDAPYINNGVLLLDLELWRREKFLAASIEFMQANRADLKRHDQTLVNCLFHDRITMLPERFNSVVVPDLPKLEDTAERIVHFIGTPKPWEPGARALNNQYGIFAAACRRLGLRLETGGLGQILKDPRSYMRLTLRKLGLHALWKGVEAKLVRRRSAP